jgi:predicted acetyltransferase
MVRWTVGTPAGSVARCTAAELAAEGPAVYERYRRAQPGALERSALWWDYLVNRPPGEEKREGDEFQVIRRDAAGVADGYARYRLKGDWRDRAPDGRVFVDELVSATDDAYVALWQHCTSVDWMRRVTAGGRPLVEPLPFMLADRRAAIQKNRGDFVWLRMIDPVACLRARCYRVEDRLVVQVVDEFGGPAAGTFVVAPGACGSCSDAPDITLSVADLSAAYLGGTPLRPALLAGRVTEHAPGAVARFDRMFLTDEPPWCNTDF